MKPTDAEILGRILPALKRSLDATDQRDIVSSCLVAMGKIGRDHETFKILEVMKPFLQSPDQEIRETAALSMGISQMTAAIADLAALATDSQAGRDLCKRGNVDDRTRAFACYGLGLIAYATNNADEKRKCFTALADVLKKRGADRNVPVAAINGIRLVRPNPEAGEKHQQLLDDCLKTLWSFYEEKLGQGDQQIQAHVPPAIAQLIGRGNDKDGKYKDVFVGELSEKFGKRLENVYQSSVIALGLLCQPQEENKADKKYSDALAQYVEEGKDEQTRYFAMMALAKIGGEKNRTELLKVFDKGSRALVKPWAAVSLGVLAYNTAVAAGESAVLDVPIGRALHSAINDIKTDETQSAIAVGLGLMKYVDAADDLEALLVKNKHKDEFAGYLCIGLALMDNKRSMDTITNIVESSVRRPELLQQAAIALGKLGDKRVTELLQQMLNDPDRNVAKLSAISSALGYIGDRRTIDPLVKMLHDESITPLSRAFAAVALGGVADKEPLPWNSKIAVDMNYRAAVETLTNGVSGILDIL